MLVSTFNALLKGPAEPSYALPDNWPLIVTASVVSVTMVIMFAAGLDIWLKRTLGRASTQHNARPALIPFRAELNRTDQAPDTAPVADTADHDVRDTPKPAIREFRSGPDA